MKLVYTNVRIQSFVDNGCSDGNILEQKVLTTRITVHTCSCIAHSNNWHDVVILFLHKSIHNPMHQFSLTYDTFGATTSPNLHPSVCQGLSVQLSDQFLSLKPQFHFTIDAGWVYNCVMPSNHYTDQWDCVYSISETKRWCRSVKKTKDESEVTWIYKTMI